MKRRILFIACVIYLSLFTAVILENCKKDNNTPTSTTPCTTPNPPIVTSNAPIDSNTTLNLYANYVTGATYKWTGPNNFSDTSRNPVVNNATLRNIGNYTLTIKVNGCESIPVSIYVVVKSSYIDQRDGSTYKTVIIGNLEWFAENMKFPSTFGTVPWKLYNNDASYLPYVGYLYNWSTATKDLILVVRGDGWRLPDTSDWGNLIRSLGGIYHAGAALKAVNPSNWAGTNVSSTNSSGFTALAAGYFSANQFANVGNETTFWSSTPYSTTQQAFAYNLKYTDTWVYQITPNQVDYYSVRLVRNRK